MLVSPRNFPFPGFGLAFRPKCLQFPKGFPIKFLQFRGNSHLMHILRIFRFSSGQFLLTCTVQFLPWVYFHSSHQKNTYPISKLDVIHDIQSLFFLRIYILTCFNHIIIIHFIYNYNVT